MAAERGRPGTEALAFGQLRDLAGTQEALIDRLWLRIAVREESLVPKEEYEAVVKKLEKEKEEHSKTRILLAKEAEKLQFALGEIEVLSKQLEREKQVFEKALSNVKSKALKESTKKDRLISKCNEIESHIMKQEDILSDKENEIKELQQFITKQKQTLKTQVSELKIQKQQESYIAQVLEKKQKKGFKVIALDITLQSLYSLGTQQCKECRAHSYCGGQQGQDHSPFLSQEAMLVVLEPPMDSETHLLRPAHI